MHEDFLHYIWKYKSFNTTQLQTIVGESITIVNSGQHNHNAGPDFFNAQLRIGEQLWAGNVEVHIKSSDWYVHNHEVDKAYDNVILHVVWEHDTDIFRSNNSVLPTLELQSYVAAKTLSNYKRLMQSKSWVNCEADFPDVDDFLLNNWLERLYFERLERKSKQIEDILKASKNDWEAVLFKMLAKTFGLKVNGDAFYSLANSFEFSVFRKLQADVLDMEALFFGQTGLLQEEHQDAYYLELQQRYGFLRQKFNLNATGVLPLQFFRLRPANFPTIRLSQLANLYAKEKKLFSKLISLTSKDGIYEVFHIKTSEFWETHYTFQKASKASKKTISKSFIDLLIINTLVPIKFAYAKAHGKTTDDDILKLISSLKLERNSITDRFLQLRPLEKTALVSQSLIQLKTEYCTKNKCLQCAVGNSLIAKNK